MKMIRVTATCDFKEGVIEYPSRPRMSMDHVEGQTYNVPEDLAQSWIKNKWAVLEGESTEGVKPEVKGANIQATSTRSKAASTEVKQ